MAKKKFFKQKREKINLTFDANDRKSFLTGFSNLFNFYFIENSFDFWIKIVFFYLWIGFQKRKAERKLKAKELLEKELKAEKLRIKQKQKERLKQLYENQRTVPEVQHLLEPTITYELPKQLVNITAFDANDISGTLGLSLGFNKTDNKTQNDFQNLINEQNSEIDSNDGNDSDSDGSNDLPQKIIDVKKSLRKERMESMKSSKAFQTKQKLKHKKDLTQSKQRRKLLKREIRQTKNKSLNKKKSNKKKNSRKNKKFSKN